MLRLMLLRHAKSSWDVPGKADFDRPLNERGRAAAPRMASYMAENGLLPERIVCSAALRAVETLALVLPPISADMEIILSRRLYEADGEGYLTAVREAGGTAASLLLVGHNPAMEDVAGLLAPVGDAVALAEMHEKFPTAGLAVIDFDGPRWSDVGPGAGRLIAFHTPKSIGGDE
ncbi:histidine phosphatase family protein [Microbaculum marinum]|uniref:Histidine phosphatase family protein n=1 Tax=Microbaculum marinum TaxID=1764581 RepID=A0AAW9S1H9_9HYPH